MASQRGRWSAALGVVLGLVLLAGCGGDKEAERVDLLASDSTASLNSNSAVFLAQIGEKTDWTVVGEPESKVGLATEQIVGTDHYSDGCHLGLLKVVLANKEQKETPFRFVFVSLPLSGTWMLRRIGVIGTGDEIQTYVGDDDVFHAISANMGRHPDHPDYVGP